MTLAPRSASWRVAKGAATACSRETTVIPSRGRFVTLIARTRQHRARIPPRPFRRSQTLPDACRNRYHQAYDVSGTILPVPFLLQRKCQNMRPGLNVARYSTLLGFDLDYLLGLGDLD